MEYTGIILIIALCILPFLAFRALFLWYWKIDTIIENQEKQIALLKRILDQSTILKTGTEINLK